MRRPGPLPPPETRSRGAESSISDEEGDAAAARVQRAPERVADSPVDESTVGETRADAVHDDGAVHDDDAGADVLDFERPRRPERPDDAAPADTDRDPDEAGIGVREVWRAARARRRALRAEVRRFTVRQRRRRMVWIAVGGSFVLLVLGTIGAAYSPLFAVDEVTVVGTSTLDPATVEAALAGQVGTPLPLVDSSAVKAALVAFPLVESYTLEAHPPHGLTVRIVERTPVGSVASAAGYTLVDAAGVALSTAGEPVAGFPVIEVTGGTTSKAFAAIGQVYRSLPEEIRSQVTAITASTANDVSFDLGDAAVSVVWGGSDESARKAIVLQRTMASIPPGQVSTYDVSSPDAVVIR